MRIVAGTLKGRKLIEFKGKNVRPTSDMTREAVFNIIQSKIFGATFLDLFAGSGAMGIEALSRGAVSVTLNDFDRESLKIIKTNIEKLNLKGVKVTNFDAITFLERASETFDFVYLDPPYNTDLGVRALEKVKNVLHNESIVIFEDQEFLSQEIDGLTVYDKRKYGKAHLTFFKRSE